MPEYQAEIVRDLSRKVQANDPRHAMDSSNYGLMAQLREALANANLTGLHAGARETEVGSRLIAELADHLEPAPRTRCIGIDGSERTPDFAFLLRPSGGEILRVAVELKVYRSRKAGAGELDRGFGQCLAYASEFDAVAVVLIFMGNPEHDAPPYWGDLERPFVLQREGRSVPIFFFDRPLTWDPAA